MHIEIRSLLIFVIVSIGCSINDIIVLSLFSTFIHTPVLEAEIQSNQRARASSQSNSNSRLFLSINRSFEQQQMKKRKNTHFKAFIKRQLTDRWIHKRRPKQARQQHQTAKAFIARELQNKRGNKKTKKAHTHMQYVSASNTSEEKWE